MGLKDAKEYAINLVKTESLPAVVEDATDWAHCHGLIIRTAEHKDRSDYCQSAPLALLPSPFPRKLFEQALAVQNAMNLLYFRISWDYNFLIQAHSEVVRTDEFTRKMAETLTAVHREGIRQKNVLLTQRADYMCHNPSEDVYELKQIEVNNIAVSMGALAQRATLLHRRLLQKLGYDRESLSKVVPDNRPVDTLAYGLFTAWKHFGDSNAAILVVVENVNQNQADQRFIEYELERLTEGGVKLIRLTLTESFKRHALLSLSDSYDLLVDNITKVALVYFRAGYSPDNYPTDDEWSARLTMERSTAIKCPWIGLQLANTKKIQQVLATPGVVERFFPGEPAVVEQVRATFAGLWGLEHEDEETLRVVKDAIEHPERYVLKPQLEGGGGNFYGEDVQKKLRELSKEQRAAHILMQKIEPLVVKNYLIRAFQPAKVVNTVSELGVYGYLFGTGTGLSVLANESHGHILRSKAEDVNEGGVAVGAAVIDTPLLVDE